MAITLEKFKQGPKDGVKKLNDMVDEVERLKTEFNKRRAGLGGTIDVIIIDNGQPRNATISGELGDLVT